MTKSFTLHRSNGVVSPCFQTDGVEREEEKWLGQELPVGASDEVTQPVAGAALPGWQSARKGGDTCLGEKKREARASASARREGKS